MTNYDKIKGDLKLELIEYYDHVKNEIDIQAQKLLLDLDNLLNDAEKINEIDPNEIKDKRKEIINTNLELIKYVDDIFNKNIEEINNYFTEQSKKSSQNLPIFNKEDIKLNVLENYCVFVCYDYLKSDLKDLYLIGVLLITDWYLNKNEVQYLKYVLFIYLF
jgi:hypothetical protein